MITIDDYLMGREKKSPLDEELEWNARATVERVNTLLSAYGKPITVSSGYRPKYVNDKTPGASPNSKHITCQAVDLTDPDLSLARWCMANLPWLSTIGLWMEHPDYTKGWVHLQTVPPKSGNRVFIPGPKPA